MATTNNRSGIDVKKDKQKVIGETFDEAKLRAFLELKPYGDLPEDFHILVKAYRGLPPEGFAPFLKLFADSGRDLSVENGQGISFLDYISENSNQQEYVDIYKGALAESGASDA